MDFKGKTAVITGGAQGIGRCIVEEFQKAGATACVIDLRNLISAAMSIEQKIRQIC
jgi:NAD(P)-dependent dehydrogenase (short-subunit alcohol dehydrogenase family)